MMTHNVLCVNKIKSLFSLLSLIALFIMCQLVMGRPAGEWFDAWDRKGVSYLSLSC